MAFGLAACSDSVESPDGASSILEPSFAKVPAECSTATLDGQARDYFATPVKQAAQTLLKEMEGACAAVPQQVATAIDKGWGLLTLIDDVTSAGTAGGTPTEGAALANGLLAYMCALPSPLCVGQPYEAVTPGMLGPQGTFEVRQGGSTTPAVARGKVPFLGYSSTVPAGVPNAALWGVQVDGTWFEATQVPTILIYGQPSSPSGVPETPGYTIQEVWYDLHTFPNVPGFIDGALHVGVCYDTDLGFPHAGAQNKELVGRVQRQGNILESFTPTFPGCRPPAAAQAGLGGVLEALLPRAVFAWFRDDEKKVSSNGGNPIDFSTFGLSGVQPDAMLKWTWEGPGGAPTSSGDYVVGQNLGPLTVWAESAAGIPFEHVLIELYVAGNQGTPAGATVCSGNGGGGVDDPTCTDGVLSDFTLELPEGINPVAYFPTVAVNKPGGFTLCARGRYAADSEVAFAEICTVNFQVKQGG